MAEQRINVDALNDDIPPCLLWLEWDQSAPDQFFVGSLYGFARNEGDMARGRGAAILSKSPDRLNIDPLPIRGQPKACTEARGCIG